MSNATAVFDAELWFLETWFALKKQRSLGFCGRDLKKNIKKQQKLNTTLD